MAPAAAAASTAPASKPGSTVSGVPVTIARVTTDSPPTWARGRQASQWSPCVDAEPGAGGRGRRGHGVVGEHHALGLAGRAAGGHDQRVARLDGTAAVQGLLAVDVEERGRGHRLEQRPAGRRGQAGVDRERGVAAVPDPLEGHDEGGPGRQGHGDQVRHGSAGYPGAMLAPP